MVLGLLGNDGYLVLLEVVARCISLDHSSLHDINNKAVITHDSHLIQNVY